MNDLACPSPEIDADKAIRDLVEQGMHRLDPLKFRYIEALSRRLTHANGTTERLLRRRLNRVIQGLREDHRKMREELDSPFKRALTDHPAQARQLRALRDSGNLPALRHRLQRLQCDTPHGSGLRALAALNGELNETSAAPFEQAPSLYRRLQQQERQASRELMADAAAGTFRELSALQAFRESSTRLHSNRLVDQSVNQGPREAGPLNPEHLAIRSLSRMQQLSPEYLNRFVGYVETLLWLQQIDNGQQSKKGKKHTRRQGLK